MGVDGGRVDGDAADGGVDGGDEVAGSVDARSAVVLSGFNW